MNRTDRNGSHRMRANHSASLKRIRTLLILALAATLLAACGAAPAEPAPEPTSDASEPGGRAVAAGDEEVITATGQVVPAEWTEVSFTVGGHLAELLVEEGDTVEAGDVIARLRATDLNAAVRQAEAMVTQAEANLAKIEAGPTEAQIAAAEEAVNAARARTAAAAARRDALSGQVTEADITAAENDLREAEQAYANAESAFNSIRNYSPEDCEELEAQGFPCPLGAYDKVETQFNMAQSQLEAARAHLTDLLDGPNPDEKALEDARVWLASAQSEAAQAQLDLLLSQPFEEEIEAARAEVAQAEAELDAARAQLAQAELTAPIGGTVSAVMAEVGEFLPPAQVVVQIGDVSTLRVETTDLNQTDAARVQTGDPVIVTFDALPGVEVGGEVVRIAPKPIEGTGVNYVAVVELDDIPRGLRWGMTAFVDIEAAR